LKPDVLSFQRYLIAVLDNIKEAVALLGIGSEGTIALLMANKAYHDITGYDRDTIGMNIFEFVDPKRHGFLKKQFEKILLYKQPVEYTIWAQVPLGRRAYEIEMIPVLTTRKNNAHEVIVMVRDITATAKLQEEVRKLKAVIYENEQSARTRDNAVADGELKEN
jgi:PAS domain S-box-containing protein